MSDLTSVTPLLKEVWAPSYEEAFSTEIVALSRIEKTSDGVTNDIAAGMGTSVGRYVVIPLKTTRSQGTGSRAERTTLPNPSSPGWSSSKVRMRTQYSVGDITAQALELANTNPRSFINALEEDQADCREAAIYDYARQVYGMSRGQLGVVSSYNAGTGVITLDATAFPYGNEYFQRTMLIDVVTTGGVVRNVGPITVSAVSSSANTITVTGTFNTNPSNTDYLVRVGNYNQEINGWQDMVQDGAVFQELDPATVPEWAASEVTHNAAYTDKGLMSLLDKVRRTASKTPTVVFTGLGVWRSIYDYLDGDRRFVNTVDFAHGVEGLPVHYKGKVIPIVDDPQYPENPFPVLNTTQGDMLAICEDAVKVYRHEKGWHFAEESGSMFIPAADRTDAWEFRLRQHSQLGTSLRSAHGRLNQVTITA